MKTRIPVVQTNWRHLCAGMVFAQICLTASAQPKGNIAVPPPRKIERPPVVQEVKSQVIGAKENVSTNRIEAKKGLKVGPIYSPLASSSQVDPAKAEQEREARIAADPRAEVRKRWAELKERKDSLAPGLPVESVLSIFGPPSFVSIHAGLDTTGGFDRWISGSLRDAIKSGKEFAIGYNPTALKQEAVWVSMRDRRLIPWPFHYLKIFFDQDGRVTKWFW